MEVTRRRGRRRKKLLDDLKDRRGYSHLKEEALDRTMWRRLWTCRQTEYWMNEWLLLYYGHQHVSTTLVAIFRMISLRTRIQLKLICFYYLKVNFNQQLYGFFNTVKWFRHILNINVFLFSKKSPWRWSQERPKHIGDHNAIRLYC